MPAIKLTAGKTKTSKRPARTSSAPKRKPAPQASQPAAKRTPKRKPAPAAAPASENGNQRAARLPEGMTQREFDKLSKDMAKTLKVKADAEEKVAEARQAVNEMALDLIAEGIPMAIVSRGLDLSRQWLYKIMEEAGVKTGRQAQASKPAAKKRPAATKPVAKKPAAKKRPAAKQAPARKAPARKPAGRATSSRGRVRISA
jgi:threonyl-tRNA synthetase